MNFNRDFKISENKTLEIEVTKESKSDLSFYISYTTRTDHAGLKFGIRIYKYDLFFAIADNRHWNYEQDRWMTKENNIEEESD